MASLERHCISTGHLPAPEMVQSLVQDTHRRSKSNNNGKNSQAYPALLPKGVPTQVELGNIICVSNNQLRSVMEKTTAKLKQVREAQPTFRSDPKRDLQDIGLSSSDVAYDEPRATTRDRLISLARHVPIHRDSKMRLKKGESQWMQSIAADRRSALRGILCVAAVAGFSASSLPDTFEAMPLALRKGFGKKTEDIKVKVQAVSSRPSRRGRPPPRPVPRPPSQAPSLGLPVARGPSAMWLAVVTAMRISSQFPETKPFVLAFSLPLKRLSICLCVARAAAEACKLPIARDGVFLRRSACAWDSEAMKILRNAFMIR